MGRSAMATLIGTVLRTSNLYTALLRSQRRCPCLYARQSLPPLDFAVLVGRGRPLAQKFFKCHVS